MLWGKIQKTFFLWAIVMMLHFWLWKDRKNALMLYSNVSIIIATYSKECVTHDHTSTSLRDRALFPNCLRWLSAYKQISGELLCKCRYFFNHLFYNLSEMNYSIHIFGFFFSISWSKKTTNSQPLTKSRIIYGHQLHFAIVIHSLSVLYLCCCFFSHTHNFVVVKKLNL